MHPEAVAKACLADGAFVTICSSNPTKLQGAVQRLDGGDKLQSHVIDVKDEVAVQALFRQIGEFDHLVYTVRYFHR
jgi:NAD(P)-dependent dehydrogenase (short-subunit alcohol dehydrogenase family)